MIKRVGDPDKGKSYLVGILLIKHTATKGALTQRIKLGIVSMNYDQLEDEVMGMEHT